VEILCVAHSVQLSLGFFKVKWLVACLVGLDPVSSLSTG
jgi:hypothetical protein